MSKFCTSFCKKERPETEFYKGRTKCKDCFYIEGKIYKLREKGKSIPLKTFERLDIELQNYIAEKGVDLYLCEVGYKCLPIQDAPLVSPIEFRNLTDYINSRFNQIEEKFESRFNIIEEKIDQQLKYQRSILKMFKTLTNQRKEREEMEKNQLAEEEEEVVGDKNPKHDSLILKPPVPPVLTCRGVPIK